MAGEQHGRLFVTWAGDAGLAGYSAIELAEFEASAVCAVEIARHKHRTDWISIKNGQLVV